MFKKIHLFVLDLFFPIQCLECQQPGTWICEKCLSKIQRRTEQVCPVCEKHLTPQGQICFDCLGKKALDGLWVTSSYQDPLLHTAVHYYKYRFLPGLAAPLGQLMTQTFCAANLPLPDLIMPVPLHPRRERWRGFNQSQLLAQELSTHLTPGLEIPVCPNILVRQKYTRPQMQIKNYQQRQLNLQNAFVLQDAQQIQNASILLVDDIATTGATLFECARLLKENGARRVSAIVLARQSSN